MWRLDTMECIEDIDIDHTISDAYLHRRLPQAQGIVGTQTTLYQQDRMLQKEENDENLPLELINRGLDEDSESEDEDENPARKIVAWPRPVIVASEEPKGKPFPIQNMSNYITQDNSPAENTRSKTRKQETILRMSFEAMLSCIQTTKHATVNPKAAASRKYPMQLLCELAGAILDQDTRDLLEYRHLLKHPKLKVTQGKERAKEVGRFESLHLFRNCV